MLTLNRNWPEHLKIKQYVPTRNLRSSKDFKLCSNFTPNTFKYSASNVFNNLPSTIRFLKAPQDFYARCRSYFKAKANDRLSD